MFVLEPTYRRDIDVLRAFAVLTVVFYHISARIIPGGFVGVDVFFVISGYLITGQLLQRLHAGHFSFLDFYTRRFRRLYPALCVVLVVTAVLGAFLLIPEAQNQLGQEMRAVATISVNSYFSRQENNYFGLIADQKPLLHMWSLSVEEQFYLVWPIFLWGIHRVVRRYDEHLVVWLERALFVLMLFSLAWCIYCSQHDNIGAFYGMPSRAWEFAAGGMLILFLPVRPPSIWGNLFQLAGLLVLCASVFLISSRELFPGTVVLAPVLGAVLFLAGGHLGLTPRWLKYSSPKAIRFVGKISYSFYLWHWVLLAMVRSWYLERNLERDFWIGGVVSFVLAYVTYRYVEQPLRRASTPWPCLNNLSFRHGLYAMLGLYVLGNFVLFEPLTLTKAQSFAERWVHVPISLPKGCTLAKSGTPLSSIDACSTGQLSNPIRIIVWGDSHSLNLLPLIRIYVHHHSIRILDRSYFGCPPLIQTLPAGNGHLSKQCLAFADAVFAEQEQLLHQGTKGVLIDAHWLLYEGDKVPGGVGLLSAQGPQQYALISGQGFLDARHALQQMYLALHVELAWFVAHQMRVAIVLPEAEMSKPSPQCLAHFAESFCNRSTDEVLRQRQALMQMFRQLAGQFPNNVRFIDTLPLFCDLKWCYARQGGIVNFTDNDHITKSRTIAMYPFYRDTLDWLSE